MAGSTAARPEERIWGYLLHLGYNMWADRDAERELTYYTARPYLQCDDAVWNDLLPKLAEAGANMVVIDLGEGVRYDSHPEIAVEGSWSKEKLRGELEKMRGLGLEPIPKLNFSTSHDAWMGEYSRMVSTPKYYEVCKDLIAEVSELFDTPRFFHLGMDEETAGHQKHFAYAVMRQYELWWHDLYFLVEQVERANVRAWVWSDYIWHHHDEFLEKMPKSVLQSNWYYDKEFGTDITYVQAFLDLEAHQYDQVPAGCGTSFWGNNLPELVTFSQEHIAPERLKGFLQTVWRPTKEDCRAAHQEAIESLTEGKRRFQQRA